MTTTTATPTLAPAPAAAPALPDGLVVIVKEECETCRMVAPLLGLFDGVTETVFDTVLQRAAPEEVHGRVFGVAHTACTASMMAGFAVAPLFARFEVPSLAMTSAAVVLCAASIIGAILLPRPFRTTSSASL